MTPTADGPSRSAATPPPPYSAPRRRSRLRFGLLATVQSLGNLAASTVAGLLWTLISPTAAFAYLTAWMVLALIGLLVTVRRRSPAASA